MFISSLRAILTLTILGAFSLHVCGFVLEPSNQQGSLVDMLVQESDENGFSCPELVARIDLEITRVDEQLQNATPEELDALLEQRESLVDLRREQPCHSEVADSTEPVVDELFTEEPVESVEEFAPMQGGGYGGGFSGGGGSGGGGALLGLAGLAGLAGLDDYWPISGVNVVQCQR